MQRTDGLVVETAGFIGEPGSGVFVYAHHPPDASSGLVICPPLLGDFVANYRREVVFARRLAAAGIAVCRFHYPGTGNSGGSWRDLTFDRMCSVVDDVAGALLKRHGSLSVGMVGTRMGAFAAAAQAAGQPSDAPLVLWDPVIDAKSHFRQAFRAEGMRNIKEQRSAAPSISEMKRHLAETGAVDLLGYSLPNELYETTLDLDLVDLLGTRRRPVLAITIGAPGAPVSAAADALRRRGFAVDVVAADSDESWWFDQQDRPAEDAIVGETVAWLSGVRVSA